jgi:hypothetical protein
VPAAAFAVGVASYDAVHIVLLLGLVITLLTSTLRVKPTLCSGGGVGSMSVQVLRVYSAVVLFTMCILYLASLDLLGTVFKPNKYKGILQILGLWHPRVVDIASFALLLAVVRKK